MPFKAAVTSIERVGDSCCAEAWRKWMAAARRLMVAYATPASASAARNAATASGAAGKALAPRPPVSEAHQAANTEKSD
jgi:hypothetical protein